MESVANFGDGKVELESEGSDGVRAKGRAEGNVSRGCASDGGEEGVEAGGRERVARKERPVGREVGLGEGERGNGAGRRSIVWGKGHALMEKVSQVGLERGPRRESIESIRSLVNDERGPHVVARGVSFRICAEPRDEKCHAEAPDVGGRRSRARVEENLRRRVEERGSTSEIR